MLSVLSAFPPTTMQQGTRTVSTLYMQYDTSTANHVQQPTFTSQHLCHHPQERSLCINDLGQRISHCCRCVDRRHTPPVDKQPEVVVRRAPQGLEGGEHAGGLLGEHIDWVVAAQGVDDPLHGGW